ncbi:hypothetical protein IWW38_003926, partial [Coemansia aciculifera]
MAPKLCEVEIVGGSAYIDDQHTTDLFEELVAQLFALSPRAVYRYHKDTVPLDLRLLPAVVNLVHIDFTSDCVDSVARLARQCASTLQSLTVNGCNGRAGVGGVSEFIRDNAGGYVEYPCLRSLRLNISLDARDAERPSFPGAVPFPSLRLLFMTSDYPFGDDVVFRKNADSLEYLEIGLDPGMTALLNECKVFSRTSHPKLRFVKTRIACEGVPYSLAEYVGAALDI